MYLSLGERVVDVLSLGQFFQAMAVLPQVMESIKQMSDADKENFIDQLGLEGEEKRLAIRVISCFQEGQELSPSEKEAAQILLEKALTLHNLDLVTLLNLNSQK